MSDHKGALIICVAQGLFNAQTVAKLGAYLKKEGYSSCIITAHIDRPISIYSLSNLPQPEIEELKECLSMAGLHFPDSQIQKT